MVEHNNFNNLVTLWIAVALLLFPLMLFVTAPYGRHSKTNWGPVIDNKFGWLIMELPALFVFTYFVVVYGNLRNAFVLIAFGLWLIHYIQRTLIYPFRLRTKGKKMPVVIMFFGIVFNGINALINSCWLSYMIPANISGWEQWSRIIIGVMLFVTGFFMNLYHDRILIRLRKTATNGYKIPYGGLFRYISCPNFLGEMIEWGGFALLCWSLPSLSFFVWTVVNLTPRALDHHKWYKREFSGYPSKRKALIPFVL
jgi:steroid 5-alpha reductase family enzyme